MNSGNVPLLAFGSTAVGVIFRGDTASPGIDLEVDYATSSGGPEVISGVLLGDSAHP